MCLLLLLVVSPVSANPVRSRRTSHHRASAEAAAAAAAAAAEAAAESADTALGVKLLLEVQKAVEQSSQHTLRSADEQLLQFLGNSRSRSSSRQATMEDQPDDAGSSRSRRSTAHWSKPCTNLMKVTSNTQESLSFEIILAVAKAMSYMGDFKNNFVSRRSDLTVSPVSQSVITLLKVFLNLRWQSFSNWSFAIRGE